MKALTKKHLDTNKAVRAYQKRQEQIRSALQSDSVEYEEEDDDDDDQPTPHERLDYLELELDRVRGALTGALKISMRQSLCLFVVVAADIALILHAYNLW